MRYRATLAYDGSAYQGFQRQRAGIPTIQATIEGAIESVTQQAVSITAAGRTDTGVHASGQVIAFEVTWRHDISTLLRAINARLPDDIALQDICIHEGFHPRFDALARRYIYTVIYAAQRQPLWNRQAWWVNTPLAVDNLQVAAAMLHGQHDFAAFGNTPQGDNTVRHIFVSQWSVETLTNGVCYRYTVEATAFLHHMVRRLVGMQVEVGSKRLSVDAFAQVFASADLAQCRKIAPPQGLVLEKVRYPDDDG